jgi:hypothetical protein
VPGAMGSSGSLALRFGQTCFSCASLLLMCLDVEFYSYTTFWYSYCFFFFFNYEFQYPASLVLLLQFYYIQFCFVDCSSCLLISFLSFFYFWLRSHFFLLLIIS